MGENTETGEVTHSKSAFGWVKTLKLVKSPTQRVLMKVESTKRDLQH
ncbi:hypothetical protein ACSVDE_02415 [Pseudalkalibacillus sp. Hm43]